jgi:hypothetical protein
VVGDVTEPLGIVAKSVKMQQAVGLARRAANVDVTVLIPAIS